MDKMKVLKQCGFYDPETDAEQGSRWIDPDTGLESTAPEDPCDPFWVQNTDDEICDEQDESGEEQQHSRVKKLVSPTASGNGGSTTMSGPGSGRYPKGSHQNEAVRNQIIAHLTGVMGMNPEKIPGKRALLDPLEGEALMQKGTSLGVPRARLEAAMDAAKPPKPPPPPPAAKPVPPKAPPSHSKVAKELAASSTSITRVAKIIRAVRDAARCSGVPMHSETLRVIKEHLKSMKKNSEVEALAKNLGVSLKRKTLSCYPHVPRTQAGINQLHPMRIRILEHLQTVHAPGGPSEHHQWMAPIGKPGMKVVVRKDPQGNPLKVKLVTLDSKSNTKRKVQWSKKDLWHDEDGKLLPKVEQKRINMMNLSPAWSGVRVATDPHARVLAFGYDDKGREQRKYKA